MECQSVRRFGVSPLSAHARKAVAALQRQRLLGERIVVLSYGDDFGDLAPFLQTDAAAIAPDDTWGVGKVDFTAAIGLAGNAVFPIITSVVVQNAMISRTTDVPTTGALRYHTHRRQLQLGKASGSRAILKLATSHQIDLGDLRPGRYYCEVTAFSADEWWTLNDADGRLYSGEFLQAEKQEQEIAEACKRLIKNCIICWNYLYLSQKLAEMDDPAHREAILNALTHGSAVAWQHVNLLGEYDFSEERLQDTVGIKPPKLVD
jgi:Tn3 transposase DDE domain